MTNSRQRRSTLTGVEPDGTTPGFDPGTEQVRFLLPLPIGEYAQLALDSEAGVIDLYDDPLEAWARELA